MTGHRRSGSSDLAFYKSPETVAQFDLIHNDLTRDLNQPVAAQDLSLFVLALQQFQDQNLGVQTELSTVPLPARIPAKYLQPHSLSASSPLYHLLKSAYLYRQEHQWTDWDLANPAKKDQHLEMILHIRQQLASNGILKNPSVAFADSVSSYDRESLSTLVHKLGGNFYKQLAAVLRRPVLSLCDHVRICI